MCIILLYIYMYISDIGWTEFPLIFLFDVISSSLF